MGNRDLTATHRARHVARVKEKAGCIATGRSQSAFRLVTYVNAFQQSTRVFNGFLIHSRGANAAGLRAE